MLNLYVVLAMKRKRRNTTEGRRKREIFEILQIRAYMDSQVEEDVKNAPERLL